MIDNTVIVGILSLIGTLAGSYCVGNKTTAVIQERLRALEEKVNKHNIQPAKAEQGGEQKNAFAAFPEEPQGAEEKDGAGNKEAQDGERGKIEKKKQGAKD